MYSNKLAACLIVKGKVVREIRTEEGPTAYLPYGSEYAIRLKNQDTRRAVVSISIDGKDVLDGRQVVINGNEETDIEATLDAATNIGRNGFKFVEKTEKISDHRGDRVDDGSIRIEWQYEELPYIPPYRPSILRSKGFEGDNYRERYGFRCSTNNIGPSGMSFAGEGCAAQDFDPAQVTMDCCSTPFNDQGITVAGSIKNQKWGTTSVGRLNAEKHVLVLIVRGKKTDGEAVVQPVLTKTKVACPTCGTKNGSAHKFCADCGTCLH